MTVKIDCLREIQAMLRLTICTLQLLAMNSAFLVGVSVLFRRSDTGFGIWDLARKLATMAKFGPFGQNRDCFGTILGPFWDFLSLF